METNRIAMNTDIFPTILSILDIDLPDDRQIDGKNIMPIFEGENSPHDVIYYTSAHTGEIKGVRNERYKYHTGGSGSFPLFKGLGIIMGKKLQLNDLLLDNESHNLIKMYPNIAEDLRNVMNAKVEELKENQRGWIN